MPVQVRLSANPPLYLAWPRCLPVEGAPSAGLEPKDTVSPGLAKREAALGKSTSILGLAKMFASLERPTTIFLEFGNYSLKLSNSRRLNLAQFSGDFG